MALKREPLLTTPKVLDSPSGEQYFRSPLMDAHLPYLFKKMLGDLLDTLVPYRNQVSETSTSLKKIYFLKYDPNYFLNLLLESIDTQA